MSRPSVTAAYGTVMAVSEPSAATLNALTIRA
jgi:hypothetical protein